MSVVVQVGLTLEELAERVGCPPPRLKIILDQEEAWGRVVCDDDGRYAIVPDSFPVGTLDALRWWWARS
jgi:hypothetical protein